MDIYDQLAERANEAGEAAMLTDKSNDTRRMFASLATMWHEAARHAHQVDTAERLERDIERKYERLLERIVALESTLRSMGLFPRDDTPMPDVFAEKEQ